MSIIVPFVLLQIISFKLHNFIIFISNKRMEQKYFFENSIE